jgi:GTP pyrophosphokinase
MLVSGLLHDTVEDTDVVTFELIGEIFGPSCQRIVEGETKFSKLSKIKKGMLKEEVQVLAHHLQVSC